MSRPEEVEAEAVNRACVIASQVSGTHHSGVVIKTMLISFSLLVYSCFVTSYFIPRESTQNLYILSFFFHSCRCTWHAIRSLRTIINFSRLEIGTLLFVACVQCPKFSSCVNIKRYLCHAVKCDNDLKMFTSFHCIFLL